MFDIPLILRLYIPNLRDMFTNEILIYFLYRKVSILIKENEIKNVDVEGANHPSIGWIGNGAETYTFNLNLSHYSLCYP